MPPSARPTTIFRSISGTLMNRMLDPAPISDAPDAMIGKQ